MELYTEMEVYMKKRNITIIIFLVLLALGFVIGTGLGITLFSG